MLCACKCLSYCNGISYLRAMGLLLAGYRSNDTYPEVLYLIGISVFVSPAETALPISENRARNVPNWLKIGMIRCFSTCPRLVLPRAQSILTRPLHREKPLAFLTNPPGMGKGEGGRGRRRVGYMNEIVVYRATNIQHAMGKQNQLRNTHV